MNEINVLIDRIEAEFREAQAQVQAFQAATVEEFEAREVRLEQFAKVCERLSEVWKPKLEAFAARLKQHAKLTPSITKTRRAATFEFQSPLARFDLTFAASTDDDVRKLVLDYNLNIVPVLMKYQRHQQFEIPLTEVDAVAVGQWLDDRIVEAVRTYLKLHQDANYLKGHLVRDPIANVEFPKYAAAATLEWKGSTYYFVGEQTRDLFIKQNQIPA